MKVDNFKAVYLILSQLEADMDKPAPDIEKISAEALCVSEYRWLRYVKMMSDCGYITGVKAVSYLGDSEPRYDLSGIEITLKGLEYLQENSVMRKIYKTAKGLTDLIP